MFRIIIVLTFLLLPSFSFADTYTSVSHTIGTSYQNTASSSVWLHVSGYKSAGQSQRGLEMQVSSDNSTWSTVSFWYADNTSSRYDGNVSGWVLPNYYYKVINRGSGNPTGVIWWLYTPSTSSGGGGDSSSFTFSTSTQSVIDSSVYGFGFLLFILTIYVMVNLLYRVKNYD